jgi:NAD(P)-dependent dehydrogenase (short-subunit alcohol dehydrogenase family)
MKTILVIGGASGIGREVSLMYAQQAHEVCVADRDEAALKALSSELGSAVHCEHIDVAQPDQVEKAVKAATRRKGLDIAINCAGIEGQVDFLVHQDDSRLRQITEINSTGLLFALKYELKQMIKQGHGSICSISSIYGLAGQPKWVPYCASKHFVVGATKAASLEVAHLGIRVNAIAPGPIHTPLLERATSGNPQRPAAFTPMRKLGYPANVAQAVQWLCGVEAHYITGAVIPIDGGTMAQISTTPDFSQVQFNV